VSSALAAALSRSRDARARGATPTRHEVRDLLLRLGETILEGRADEVQAGLEEVRGWLRAAPAAWRGAIDGELSMAVTEHVRSVDPRWLDHPRYDLAYTVEARHLLEARVRAAEALGVEVPDALLAAMARADAVLAPRLARPR